MSRLIIVFEILYILAFLLLKKPLNPKLGIAADFFILGALKENR